MYFGGYLGTHNVILLPLRKKVRFLPLALGPVSGNLKATTMAAIDTPISMIRKSPVKAAAIDMVGGNSLLFIPNIPTRR